MILIQLDKIENLNVVILLEVRVQDLKNIHHTKAYGKI